MAAQTPEKWPTRLIKLDESNNIIIGRASRTKGNKNDAAREAKIDSGYFNERTLSADHARIAKVKSGFSHRFVLWDSGSQHGVIYKDKLLPKGVRVVVESEDVIGLVNEKKPKSELSDVDGESDSSVGPDLTETIKSGLAGSEHGISELPDTWPEASLKNAKVLLKFVVKPTFKEGCNFVSLTRITSDAAQSVRDPSNLKSLLNPCDQVEPQQTSKSQDLEAGSYDVANGFDIGSEYSHASNDSQNSTFDFSDEGLEDSAMNIEKSAKSVADKGESEEFSESESESDSESKFESKSDSDSESGSDSESESESESEGETLGSARGCIFGKECDFDDEVSISYWVDEEEIGDNFQPNDEWEAGKKETQYDEVDESTCCENSVEESLNFKKRNISYLLNEETDDKRFTEERMLKKPKTQKSGESLKSSLKKLSLGFVTGCLVGSMATISSLSAFSDYIKSLEP